MRKRLILVVLIAALVSGVALAETHYPFSVTATSTSWDTLTIANVDTIFSGRGAQINYIKVVRATTGAAVCTLVVVNGTALKDSIPLSLVNNGGFEFETRADSVFVKAADADNHIILGSTAGRR